LGFALVVVTNQPDIARKRQEACVVAAMHAHLTSAIHLDAVYVCPHDDDDRCECRKPAPGMLIAASSDLDLDLARSFMVGDRWRDIEAGKRAGCRTIHIDYGYDEEGPEAPDAIVVDLPSAVSWIKSVSADTKESRSA
jgi:D-glycero-D-manno-heptose 1,7-bisphosphate phosphatase